MALIHTIIHFYIRKKFYENISNFIRLWDWLIKINKVMLFLWIEMYEERKHHAIPGFLLFYYNQNYPKV